MKITDSEIIKNGEQELIDAITADLDWGAIDKIFLKEHNLSIEEDIEYKSGDIVAVDNKIAYKLEFEVKVNLSVLLDRNGEYLSVNIYNKNENPQQDENIEIVDDQETDASDNQLNLETENTDKTISSYENEEEVMEQNDDSETFVDLPIDENDDMGQKVDDVLKNIKKAD